MTPHCLNVFLKIQFVFVRVSSFQEAAEIFCSISNNHFAILVNTLLFPLFVLTFRNLDVLII